MEGLNKPKTNSFTIDAVVGKANEEKRGQLFDSLRESFDAGYLDSELSMRLLKYESEKTPEDVETIARANTLTSNYRKKFRDNMFEFPSKNIHFIDNEKLKEQGLTAKTGSTGYFNVLEQSIFLAKEKDPIMTLSTLIHEMNHSKSHNKIILDKKPLLSFFSQAKKGIYRGGIIILDTENKALCFRNLNEAITETITGKILWDERKHLFTPQEIGIITRVSHKEGLRPENFFGIDAEKFRKGENFLPQMSYTKQMKIYYRLIQKMAEKSGTSEESIEELFERSYYTGNLHELAHKVEQLYGPGSFRTMATIDTDTKKLEALKTFIDSPLSSPLTSAPY